MTLEPSHELPGILAGFGRSATEQALQNLAEALRALELAPQSTSELCPHPLTIVRAEIENARRYLSLPAKPAARPHAKMTSRTKASARQQSAAA